MGLIGVIPAAGKATRMGELGASLPKALIEVDGRTLLERSIEMLKYLKVSRIVVVVGHLGEKIVERVSGVEFAYQEQPLGLAHAIATANPDDDFVVLCPDNIYTDYRDLLRARKALYSYEAVFVLVGTVTPNTQRDRKAYFTSAHKNRGRNVYYYRPEYDNTAGLAINSTGCTFFKREALDYLPSFSNHEHIFRDYLDRIPNGLLYLLRGMRYDFSGPEDIDNYQVLQRRLHDANGQQGVSAILINPQGQVLLQQRDDNPSIRYPGHWSLFGGTIEGQESAADAVAREVKEEIDFDLRNFGLFREFVQNNKQEFAFAGELDARLDELTLSEGQGMNFFFPSQLKELQIRPDDKETLEQYFGAGE
jgi:8-oxo-dGTP diphosphatase